MYITVSRKESYRLDSTDHISPNRLVGENSLHGKILEYRRGFESVKRLGRPLRVTLLHVPTGLNAADLGAPGRFALQDLPLAAARTVSRGIG